MSRIEWDQQAFTVFNDELDRQHQELIRQYNSLHESMVNGSLEDAVKEKDITLEQMVSYATQHFHAEEQFLKRIDYPDLERHCQIHHEFRDKVKYLQQDLAENRMILGTALMKFLRNWIIDHIAEEDKKYANHARIRAAADK